MYVAVRAFHGERRPHAPGVTFPLVALADNARGHLVLIIGARHFNGARDVVQFFFINDAHRHCISTNVDEYTVPVFPCQEPAILAVSEQGENI